MLLPMRKVKGHARTALWESIPGGLLTTTQLGKLKCWRGSTLTYGDCQGTPDFTSDFTSELRRLPPSTFYFFRFLTLHPSLSSTPSIILRTTTPMFPPTSDLFLLGHSDLVVLFPYFLIWFHFYYLILFHPLFNYLLFPLTPFWVLKPSSLSRGPYPFLLGPPAR